MPFSSKVLQMRTRLHRCRIIHTNAKSNLPGYAKSPIKPRVPEAPAVALHATLRFGGQTHLFAASHDLRHR